MSKMGAKVLDQQEAESVGAPIADSPQEFGSNDDTQELGAVELLDPAKPIAKYNPIRAAIADLTKQYGNLIFEVSTTKGLEDAKQARMAIRNPRYKIEHIRKELKAPALAYSKRIDDEAKKYTADLLALETPIDDQITAEEKRKADEKARIEREAAEARQKIGQAISDIQFITVYAAGKNAVQVQTIIDELDDRVINEAEFGDRLPEAVLAKNATMSKLREMLAAAMEQEVEAARLRTEREEAERIRLEQEATAARIQQEQADLERRQQEFARQQAAAAPIIAAPAVVADVAELRDDEPTTAPDDSNPFPDDSVPFPEEPATSAPTLADMVEVIANHYDVAPSIAYRWLRETIR